MQKVLCIIALISLAAAQTSWLGHWTVASGWSTNSSRCVVPPVSSSVNVDSTDNINLYITGDASSSNMNAWHFNWNATSNGTQCYGTWCVTGILTHPGANITWRQNGGLNDSCSIYLTRDSASWLGNWYVTSINSSNYSICGLPKLYSTVHIEQATSNSMYLFGNDSVTGASRNWTLGWAPTQFDATYNSSNWILIGTLRQAGFALTANLTWVSNSTESHHCKTTLARTLISEQVIESYMNDDIEPSDDSEYLDFF